MSVNESSSGVSTSIIGAFNRLRSGAGVFGFIGIIGLIAAFFLEPDHESFFASYLFAYIFWVAFSIGCFGITVLHSMIRATWSLSILRIMEAGARTLPYMAIAFLPILLGVWTGHIYPWASHDPSVIAHSETLQRKIWYLNPTFFTIRAVLYFAFWIGFSNYLNRSSLKQDETLDNDLAVTRARRAAPAFLLLVLTLTFAMTDWVMSLDNDWYSTIFGLWFMITMGMLAVCLGVIIVCSHAERKPYNDVVTVNLTRDLGNILLMLTMLWAYTSLAQFLIIWSGNLPEEIIYYVKRFQGGLLYIGTFLIFFQFFIPFTFLLSGRTKRTPQLLRLVAGGLLFVRLVDIFWTVTPFFRAGLNPANLPAYALDLAAIVGLGGIWLVIFAGEVKKHSLIPYHDTRLQEAYQELKAHHA